MGTAGRNENVLVANDGDKDLLLAINHQNGNILIWIRTLDFNGMPHAVTILSLTSIIRYVSLFYCFLANWFELSSYWNMSSFFKDRKKQRKNAPCKTPSKKFIAVIHIANNEKCIPMFKSKMKTKIKGQVKWISLYACFTPVVRSGVRHGGKSHGSHRCKMHIAL